MNAPIDSGVIPYVLSDTRDGVRTLTLNRGERYNALSRDMLQALEREIDDVAATPAVRAVVIAAAGKGFCAGHDLKELRAHPDEGWQRELFGACSRVMVKLTELPQPVIARVHGIATAAGCQLVSMCDLPLRPTPRASRCPASTSASSARRRLSAWCATCPASG